MAGNYDKYAVQDTRTSGRLRQPRLHLTFYWPDGHVTSGSYGGYGVNEGTRTTCTSVRRWRFSRRSRKYRQALPPNPFYSEKRTGESKSASLICTVPSGPYKGLVIYGYYNPLICGGSFTQPPEIQALVTKTLVELHSRASEPDFDTLRQLGEMKELVQGLTSPMRSLRSLSPRWRRQMRRAARKRAKKLARTPGKPKAFSRNRIRKAASDTWLEYQLGLVPPVKSMDETMKKLVDLSVEKTPIIKCSARNNLKSDVVVTEGSRTFGPFTFYYEIRKWTDGYANAGCQYLPYTRTPNAGGNPFGGVGTEVLAQSWELIPLSFCVDWVIGIGDMLRACRPQQGRWLFHWSSSVSRSVEEVVITKIVGYGQTLSGGASAKTIRSVHIRTPEPGNPGIPPWTPRLSSFSKLLTLTALSADNLSKGLQGIRKML